MTNATATETTCGFCGRDHTEVERLVVGKFGGRICSDCVRNASAVADDPTVGADEVEAP